MNCEIKDSDTAQALSGAAVYRINDAVRDAEKRWHAIATGNLPQFTNLAFSRKALDPERKHSASPRFNYTWFEQSEFDNHKATHLIENIKVNSHLWQNWWSYLEDNAHTKAINPSLIWLKNIQGGKSSVDPTNQHHRRLLHYHLLNLLSRCPIPKFTDGSLLSFHRNKKSQVYLLKAVFKEGGILPDWSIRSLDESGVWTEHESLDQVEPSQEEEYFGNDENREFFESYLAWLFRESFNGDSRRDPEERRKEIRYALESKTLLWIPLYAQHQANTMSGRFLGWLWGTTNLEFEGAKTVVSLLEEAAPILDSFATSVTSSEMEDLLSTDAPQHLKNGASEIGYVRKYAAFVSGWYPEGSSHYASESKVCLYEERDETLYVNLSLKWPEDWEARDPIRCEVIPLKRDEDTRIPDSDPNSYFKRVALRLRALYDQVSLLRREADAAREREENEQALKRLREARKFLVGGQAFIDGWSSFKIALASEARQVNREKLRKKFVPLLASGEPSDLFLERKSQYFSDKEADDFPHLIKDHFDSFNKNDWENIISLSIDMLSSRGDQDLEHTVFRRLLVALVNTSLVERKDANQDARAWRQLHLLLQGNPFSPDNKISIKRMSRLYDSLVHGDKITTLNFSCETEMELCPFLACLLWGSFSSFSVAGSESSFSMRRSDKYIEVIFHNSGVRDLTERPHRYQSMEELLREVRSHSIPNKTDLYPLTKFREWIQLIDSFYEVSDDSMFDAQEFTLKILDDN